MIGTSRSASAQTAQFEPVLSYEYGYPLAIERSPGIINKFRTSGLGTSYNHTFGIGAALRMPDLFSSGIGLAPRLEFRLGLGKFSSEQFRVSQFDTGGQPVMANEHFEVRSTTQSIDLTLPVEFSTSSVGFGIGPWTSVEFSRKITGTEYIDSPPGISFDDGSISREFASGDTISVSHLHAGIEADLLFRMPLSKTLSFEPRLFGRLDLASSSDVKEKAFSAGISLSLCPLVVTGPDVVRPPDTVFTAARRPSTALTASIHFTKNGIRTTSNTPIEIVGNTTAFRQYTEIPDCIGFATGSSAIPPTYEILADTGVNTFRLASLTRVDLRQFAKQLLNVIGYRLATDSLSHLELVAGPKRIDARLLTARCSALTKYWADVWKIDRERISTSITTANAEHRLSDSVRLKGPVALAPVATQWIEQSYHIPHMGIEKSIIADQGLRSWEIDIRQNDRVLSTFRSADVSDENAIADFDLAGDSSASEAHRDPAPLVATLHAEDFAGQRVEVSDTLLLPSREELNKHITQREVFVFVLLPDKSSQANRNNTELLLQKLLSVVHPDAHISISDPPNDAADTDAAALEITERIVSELKRHTELHPDFHIFSRSDTDRESPPYERSVIVRIEQLK